jgi:NAD(P)-dependent dehydrogenase (short-subunit alcohol dehydrogenase family)
LDMKTALVTGGAKGIGLAISQELVALGWNVVVTGRDAAAIDTAVAGLASGPGKAIGRVMDVRDRTSIDSVIADTRSEFGTLDSLINCAGVIIRDESEVLSEADWETVIDTDLSGVFKCSQAAFADLEKAKGATIVNVGSIAGSVGIAGRAGYTAAKAGLEGLTRTLGLEWADRDIRVNAVAPGWTRTEMVAGGIKDGRLSEAALTSRIPQKRLAEPSEIAKVVLFLMSSDSSYITGQTITVDGGITINGNT